MDDDRLGGLFDGTSRNATLAWSITVVLCVLAAGHALDGSYRWFAFTCVALAVVVAPAVAFRDPRVMPPSELLLVIAVPVVDATVFGRSFLTAIAVYVAVAAVALVVAVEIHRFTPARMNHVFAVGLVVIATLAVAATWNVAQWASDAALGTSYIVGGRSQDAANHGMMVDFAYALVAGLLAGVVFDRYFRLQPGSNGAGRATARSETPIPAPPPEERTPAPSLVRDRLDVPESYVRTLSRAMQIALGGILLYGLVTHDPTMIVNAGLALGITFLPAVLEHDSRLPLEPELALWLTTAVFLHSLGSAGLYDLVGPWDTLTHTLSATIVAAAGYAVVRAIDLHTDEIYLPPKLLFVFILLFVLAFGVVWELGEFALDLSAQRFGIEAVLSQHGIDDTIVDLVFDFVGAVVVAAWGSVYLTDVSHRIADRFGR
ncbi:hypothetical protein [Halalkalicoccus sp. NIPERK01]|uniref:hypothetical protein n=1 Tax=Halalkalicoccus sp. NIPERK01 TaxID=3053469 RepID=UPI00256F245F|nr:hypothetical protein [Halalkalicoccus sp. NIPERK01]MDL5363782.1 hypothetical protein [Halalkalicoccus sp. NIPERK01]